MMGLYDSAYWLSWLTWEGILTLVSSIFIIFFGMMFQFDFFLNNSFAVVFLVFFLFELNMVRLLPLAIDLVMLTFSLSTASCKAPYFFIYLTVDRSLA